MMCYGGKLGKTSRGGYLWYDLIYDHFPEGDKEAEACHGPKVTDSVYRWDVESLFLNFSPNYQP